MENVMVHNFYEEDHRIYDLQLEDFADILNEEDVRELMGLTGRIVGLAGADDEERA